MCSFISSFGLLLIFDRAMLSYKHSFETVVISNVNYIITRVFNMLGSDNYKKLLLPRCSGWSSFLSHLKDDHFVVCFDWKFNEKHQWCDLFWRPLALHKINFAVTSQTWSAAHASSRSFSGESPRLEKMAEIEPKSIVKQNQCNPGFTCRTELKIAVVFGLH